MSKIEVRLEQRQALTLYGVRGAASDRTLAKDIPRLSAAFHEITGTKEGTVLPFFVLSQNYEKASGTSELFIAGLRPCQQLEALALPAGEYACITVRPKLGLFWGLAVGEAKRYFYTSWLPQSDYCGENLEYEYHTERSIGKHPTVDIVFAIRKVPK